MRETMRKIILYRVLKAATVPFSIAIGYIMAKTPPFDNILFVQIFLAFIFILDVFLIIGDVIYEDSWDLIDPLDYRENWEIDFLKQYGIYKRDGE